MKQKLFQSIFLCHVLAKNVLGTMHVHEENKKFDIVNFVSVKGTAVAKIPETLAGVN